MLKENEMTLEEAVSMVLELASENILDEEQAEGDPEVLVPMRDAQLQAVDMVQTFFKESVK